MLWTALAVDLFVGLQAGGAVAYATFSKPSQVNVGRPPASAGTLAQPQATTPQPAPVAITIPSIGVKSDLATLNVDGEGVLNGPEDFSVAGWWAGGPAPGAIGAAVVVGHLDSFKGPAVFFRVPSLQPGGRIDVTRADGSIASFVIDAVQQYPKDKLPTERVYGSTTRPELRLITCGGEFDRARKSYRDNVVVYAHEQDPAQPGRAA